MDEGLDPIFDFIAASWNNFDITIVHNLATVFWYLEKVSAFITDFLTQENLWETLLGTLLQALQNIFPDILNSLLFGSDGSAGGLLYLALMLAGLFLILPHISGTRLVEPGRVFVWAIILIALFVGSMWGYDLIGVMESLRQSSTQIVIDAVSDTGSLSDLVTQPMQAEPGELADWSFNLPSAFANFYYPQPGPDDYDTREVVILDNWVTGRWAYELQVETQASQDFRLGQSRQGILMAALTLVPAFVLILFGITFATLAASALVLIIFFLTSLPLGFFEFGAPILMGIAKQYAYLFALTLAATILPGILVGAGTLTFNDVPGIGDMIAYLPILIIVAIAAQYMAQMSWSAMTGTFGIVSSSVRASVGSYAYSGSLPDAGGIPGTTAGSAALGLAALAGAAATGGASALLMGAVGVAGGQGEGNGSTLATHAFTHAANSSSQNNGRQSTQPPVQNRPDRAIWSAPNAPHLLSHNVLHTPGALGEDKSASVALQGVAKDMNLSDDSIAKIFEAVHEAEKEADAVEGEEQQAKDPVSRTADKITQKGIGSSQAPYDIHELARLATLVATTAHLNNPKGMAARVVHAPQSIPGNQPAALAMQQMVQKLKLDQGSVETVFHAVKEGHKLGISSKNQVKFVQDEVSRQVPGRHSQLQELSRLAVLVDAGLTPAQPQPEKEKKTNEA